MGFDVALVDHCRVEGAIHDVVRFGKAGFDIPELVAEVRSYVGWLGPFLSHRIGAQIVPENGRVRFHCLFNIQHQFKQFVLNLNQFDGVQGRLQLGGRHSRHRVAVEQHLVAGHDIGAEIVLSH